MELGKGGKGKENDRVLNLSTHEHSISLYFFWLDRGLNSGICAYKADALSHASYSYLEDGGLTNYLPGLAWNSDPPYFSLLSEPLAPGSLYFFRLSLISLNSDLHLFHCLN
jgi:hypothetical protein